MLQPITTKELIEFLQIVIDCFSDPIFFALTAMLGGLLAYNTKRLFYD